jgi:FAD/FMN-containing dehydrogenase
MQRRRFISGLGAAALGTGVIAAGKAAPVAASSAHPRAGPPSELEHLRAAVGRDAPNYELWRESMIWQRRKSPRYPGLIVQVDSAQDVAEAVSYARKHRLKVTTRCGGHSASACFLRDGGMLIDVSRLSGIEVDAQSGQFSAGPGAIAREVNARLGRFGLAFPTAHCGMVPLGGFLLGGGLGLNGNAWGLMSAFNILAAEVVTADGRIRHASPTENPDLYWSLRGGGPGLYGVVTQLFLKAYELPRAIVHNTITFAFRDLRDVIAALTEIGPKIDPDVEMLGYVGPADPQLTAHCADADCRRTVSLDANAYTTSTAESARKIRPLAEHPIIRRAIAKELGSTTTIEALYFDEELGFSQRRWVADNVFTNRAEDVAAILHERMPSCPSADAQAVFLYKGNPKLPDAACSTMGDFYASYYVIWDNPTEDPVMVQYLRDLYREIAPLGTGSNINEMDQEGRPDQVKSCYSPAAWEKLQSLRLEWDPDGVFQNFYGIP